MLRTGSALLIALICAGNALAAAPTVEGLRADEPIVIDGKLSEQTWQAGEWYSDFKVLDMPDKTAAQQTRFKIRFDGANVFIGVQADEPNVGGMVSAATQRDGKVYSDDCIEVMIDPTGERIEYYHIVVNSLGTFYDAQMRQGGNVQSIDWNCSLETAAAVGEGTWSVEMRLPVVEMGLNAASTTDWAINVTRERQVDVRELSTFAPMTGGFHQPSLYAALKLPGADFGKYLWRIKNPYEVRVLPEEGGKLVYSAKTHVKNEGPRFRFIMVRGVLGDSAGEWVKDGLDAGQGREYELKVPVAAQGKQSLKVEIADRGEPELTLAVKSLQAQIAYTPIAITVMRPWYRDSIYATEDLKEIVFDVTLSVPEDELGKLSAKASLTGTDEAHKLMCAQTAPAKPEMSMRLQIPELPVGEYALKVDLIGEDPEPAHSATKIIRKLPPVANEWRINEKNVLLHNGEPVLPFSWFSIPHEKMAEEGHAYQLMQEYNTQYLSVEKALAHLDDIAASGTAAAIYPYPGSTGWMSPSTVWGEPLSDEHAELLRQRIEALKDNPGVAAWYMADEPELRPALPERCRRLYETVRDEDPFHPCIMLNDTIAGIYKYVDGGDVLMPDPYPCFIQGGLAAQPLEKTSSFMKACQEASSGRKAIWITPQGFNYGDYGKKNQRGPNLREMRNQLYQAVVYGAKGFLWYTYGQVSNYPDLDIGMRWLSFEVADLKDAILENPAADVKIAIDAPMPEHIHVSPRKVGDDLYIFAVNTATEPQQVKLTIGPALGLRSLYVVSEQRNADLVNGTVIEDTFDVYQSHVYTTNADAGQREDIAVPEGQIAKADAARKKPGNLAFEDSGATVETSSRSTYGSTPDRVLDGMLTGMRWTDGTPDKLPDWINVTWPEAQTIKRVVIYSPSVASFELQVPDGDGWKTVGSVTQRADDRLEVSLDNPVETDAIRVLVTGLSEGETTTLIWEVEAYAK